MLMYDYELQIYKLSICLYVQPFRSASGRAFKNPGVFGSAPTMLPVLPVQPGALGISSLYFCGSKPSTSVMMWSWPVRDRDLNKAWNLHTGDLWRKSRSLPTVSWHGALC